MREHIKHASDGLFNVVAFFIGLGLLLFILLAFSSLISSLFGINFKDPSTVKTMFIFGLIGGPLLALSKIIWQQGNKK